MGFSGKAYFMLINQIVTIILKFVLEQYDILTDCG